MTRSQETTLVRATVTDPRGRVSGVERIILLSIRIGVAGSLRRRVPVLRFLSRFVASTYHTAIAVAGLVVVSGVACTRSGRSSGTRDAGETSSRSDASQAQLRDDYGDPIVLGVRPRRIVSLNPTTTEMLFTMGAQSRVVGRSRWDVWPDAARYVPDLGDAIRLNVEMVLAAHPDLVLLYASLDNRAAALRLRAAGVTVLGLKVDRIRDFDRVMRLIGRIVGDSIGGATVADSVGRTLERVRTATARLEHPTVVWPFSYRPAMVVGGGSFMNDLLDVAGAQNIYADLHQPSPIVTIEDVVRQDPRYVIRSVDLTQSVTQPTSVDAAWRAVPAVRAGRIFSAPAELLSRPSVRLGEGAVALARLLHPGVEIR